MTTERAAASERPWLCDVNVLLAYALSHHQHHRAARLALSQHGSTWATCPITEASLTRLLLNPRVSGHAFGTHEIFGLLGDIRALPRWRWVADDTSLATPMIDTSVLVGHQQVTDLHLVNLAASHDLLLATFDAAIPGSLAPADRGHVHVLPG